METEFLKKTAFGSWIKFCFCICLAAAMSGCAFSRTQVPLSFSPNVTQTLSGTHKGSLEVGEVKDTRLVTDGLVLMQKSNEYGPTSGAYVTVQPVAEIFRDGLKTALEQNGFAAANATQFELHAELQNFAIGVIQNGLLSSLTAKPWLEVRFELFNKATGQAVWHDTYTGQTTEQLSAWTGEDGKFIATAFSAVAQEVVKQLLTDKSFRSFFE